MASDAPDWQKVLVLQSGGTVSDAPDWQRVATGPGSSPLGGGTINGDWCPQDFGWSAWTTAPTSPGLGLTPMAQQPTVSLMKAMATVTLTKVTMFTWAAGTGLVANDNYLGLYTAPETGGVPGHPALLGATAQGAIDATISAAGVHTYSLATGVPVVAGQFYYAALLLNNSGAMPTLGYSAWLGGNTTNYFTLLGLLPGFRSTATVTSFPGTLTPPAPGAGNANMYGPWMAFA